MVRAPCLWDLDIIFVSWDVSSSSAAPTSGLDGMSWLVIRYAQPLWRLSFQFKSHQRQTYFTLVVLLKPSSGCLCPPVAQKAFFPHSLFCHSFFLLITKNKEIILKLWLQCLFWLFQSSSNYSVVLAIIFVVLILQINCNRNMLLYRVYRADLGSI